MDIVEKLAQLGINGELLVAQILNFLLLLGLLYLFAYKPILRMFDERSRRIKDSMDLTDTIREQAENAEEAARLRIEEANREGQELVAQAIKTSEEIKLKAEEDAKPEVEAMMVRGRQQLDQERDEALTDLRREFSDLTIIAAEKVIEKELDKDKHKELIDKVLEDSNILKKK